MMNYIIPLYKFSFPFLANPFFTYFTYKSESQHRNCLTPSTPGITPHSTFKTLSDFIFLHTPHQVFFVNLMTPILLSMILNSNLYISNSFWRQMKIFEIPSHSITNFTNRCLCFCMELLTSVTSVCDVQFNRHAGT